MEIICLEKDFVVCLKPAGVLSTDEPGGLPELIRAELGDEKADIRTVHRLDRVVGGLMVLARNAQTASELSKQMRAGTFEKKYRAVVHGNCDDKGQMVDLMYRDMRRRISRVTDTPGKGVQEAILNYWTLGRCDDMSLVEIELITGRTHQIRCQFSSRNMPLVGERKYSTLPDDCPMALWSCYLSFTDMKGVKRTFTAPPPQIYPWDKFE